MNEQELNVHQIRDRKAKAYSVLSAVSKESVLRWKEFDELINKENESKSRTETASTEDHCK